LGNIMSTIINATTTNGVVIEPDNSGSLVLQTNSGTTALTIDTSQNVGIGTASPATKLHIISGSTVDPLRLQSTSSGFERTWTIGPNVGGNGIFAIRDTTDGANRLNIDTSGNLQFNSGYGSAATAYGCRAWVNFNGTGTPAIRASGNVSSITDNGTGNYTVNFTTAMPDVNYSGVIGSGNTTTSDPGRFLITINNSATSSCSIFTKNANTGTLEDYSVNCVAIFR
jgi:hypothetical protein